jgi:hypothetical protein
MSQGLLLLEHPRPEKKENEKKNELIIDKKTQDALDQEELERENKLKVVSVAWGRKVEDEDRDIKEGDLIGISMQGMNAITPTLINGKEYLVLNAMHAIVVYK